MRSRLKNVQQGFHENGFGSPKRLVRISHFPPLVNWRKKEEYFCVMCHKACTETSKDFGMTSVQDKHNAAGFQLKCFYGGANVTLGHMMTALDVYHKKWH